MQMISGDNKGYASYLMEKRINGNTTLPGKGSFVAAFASTNLGDVSPNTAGPRCIDTGELKSVIGLLHFSDVRTHHSFCISF
jgi:hypothetical protein